MKKENEFILKIEEENGKYILTVLKQKSNGKSNLLTFEEIEKMIVKSYDDFHFEKEKIMNGYNIISIWDI